MNKPKIYQEMKRYRCLRMTDNTRLSDEIRHVGSDVWVPITRQDGLGGMCGMKDVRREIECEEDYRFLTNGEVILPVDEYLAEDSNTWEPASGGGIVFEGGVVYRRKTKPIKHWLVDDPDPKPLAEELVSIAMPLRVDDFSEVLQDMREACHTPSPQIRSIRSWIEQRCRDLIEAMHRRETIDTQTEIWAHELTTHLNRIKEMPKQ